MKIDLHMHSNCSDGTDDIKTLLQNIVKNNISVFSLTDHDNIKGCKLIRTKYAEYLQKHNLKFINGIEFSTDDNGVSVHILAYNFDIDNPVIKKLISKGKKLRLKRIKYRLEMLEQQFNISLSDADKKYLLNLNNPGKSHIAKILIKNGFGVDNDITKTMNKYMYHKMPTFKLTSEETVLSIKEAGAIPVIAHPLGGTGEKEVDVKEFASRIKRLKTIGLKGIECFYSIYNENQRNKIKQAAADLNLKLSGGSDYHGTNKNINLAQLSVEGIKVTKKDLTILTLIK